MCENRNNPGYIQGDIYKAAFTGKKELRRRKKLKGIHKGRIKAARFYNLVFGRYDEPHSHGTDIYKYYRGIFKKTRSGKYFNKDYGSNNKKIALLNKYIWMTEAQENIGVCRISRKKAGVLG